MASRAMVSAHIPLGVLWHTANAILGCTDCLCACCCGPCDLVQQDKEAEFREGEMAQFIHVQPEKMNGGMQYGQPQQQHYTQ